MSTKTGTISVSKNGSPTTPDHVKTKPLPFPPQPPTSNENVYTNGYNGNGHHMQEQYKHIAHIEDDATPDEHSQTNGNKIQKNAQELYDNGPSAPADVGVIKNGNGHLANGRHLDDEDEDEDEVVVKKSHQEFNGRQVDDDDDKPVTEVFMQEHVVELMYKNLKETSITDDITDTEQQVSSRADQSASLEKSKETAESPVAVASPPKVDTSNRFMYKVRATYAYDAKEIDELQFNKDEVIIVVEGSESEKEELDEGWLIGIHENSRRRGLFPENFTRKI